MNTLINLQVAIADIYRQLQRGQIGETAALARIEVKIEQMSIETAKISALLCATCDEIGRPANNVVEVAFKPTREE
tara:strand:+ start:498 stop:725 length:228 start_codon:yes stop_codon:yes gene_type:complete